MYTAKDFPRCLAKVLSLDGDILVTKIVKIQTITPIAIILEDGQQFDVWGYAFEKTLIPLEEYQDV